MVVLEFVLTAVLVLQFLGGLALLAVAVYLEKWYFIVPGGLLEALLFVPVMGLTKMRKENVALQTIPALLPLANDQEAKKQVLNLIVKLIERL